MFDQTLIDMVFNLKGRTRIIVNAIFNALLVVSFILLGMYVFLLAMRVATEPTGSVPHALSSKDSASLVNVASKAAHEAFIDTTKREPLYVGKPIYISPGYFVEIKVSGYEGCGVSVISQGIPKSWVAGRVTCSNLYPR